MSDVMGLSLHEVIDRARRAAESREWTPAVNEDGGRDVPDSEREVLVFLNGHVDIGDHAGRQGGGWGIRLGFFDHDRRCWRVGGRPEHFVTHWMELPAPPPREARADVGREGGR